jgi:PmbA protein
VQDDELIAIAARVAERAAPGEQIEAYVAWGTSTSVRAYAGEVEAFTSAESRGIGIRVVVDGRQGFAHAGTLDEDVLAETLAEARDNARFAEPDEWNGLAVPDGVPAVPQALWHDEVLRFPAEEKIRLAIELERRVRNGDPRISGVRPAVFADSAGAAAVVTSTGIRAAGRGTACSLSVSALASADGETTTGYGVDVARTPDGLDLERAAEDAVERATRLLGATQPASGRTAIVLEPRLASSLLGIVAGMCSGERVLKGRTPFAGRVGERIASPLLTLVDDPTDPASFGAESHDGEGLACRRTPLLLDGVLQGFLQNAYTGRRSGTASTGSAVRGTSSVPAVGAQALALAPGAGSLDELVAGVDDGILVQSFAGLHSGVNAVSGDFSVGVEGLRIRSGVVGEPIREATVASTVQRLLTGVVAVGSDLTRLPDGTSACTLVIDDVSLSGR